MRDQTDFKDNAIGIDPRGCACTDCMIGYSVPLNHKMAIKTIAGQALRGRPVINRSSIPLVLLWDVEDIIEVPDDAADKWRFSVDAVVLVANRTAVMTPGLQWILGVSRPGHRRLLPWTVAR